MKKTIFLIILLTSVLPIFSDTIIIYFKDGTSQKVVLKKPIKELKGIELNGNNIPEEKSVKENKKNPVFQNFEKEMKEKLKPSFEGVWKTNFGNLVIKVNGEKVYGIYKNGEGKIIGNLNKDGTIFTGKWMEAPDYKPPKHAGRVILKLSKTGMTFKGVWGFGEEEPDSQWIGRKIKE